MRDIYIRYKSDINLWKIWEICTNNKQALCIYNMSFRDEAEQPTYISFLKS